MIATFGELFTALDERPSREDCDGVSLRIVREICKDNGVDADLVVPVLKQHGGHCDCEVLMNAAGKIGAGKRLPVLA